jgi:hypothetical protein
MMVGVPATPRYGHTLNIIDTAGEELLLLGGCTVSASSAGISEDMEDLQMQVYLKFIVVVVICRVYFRVHC